jgi:mono/diheme cytochrome c family protein
MVRWMIALMWVVMALPIALGASPPPHPGAEQIPLAGGNQGTVPFPHRRHQLALNDCMICHTLFAQAPGSIAKAKTEGKLAPKQIMNTHCIQCHRDRKQAGQPSGPIACAKCHVKE